MFSFFVLNSNFKSNTLFRNSGSFSKSDNKFNSSHNHYNNADKFFKSSANNKGSHTGISKYFSYTPKTHDDKITSAQNKKYFSKPLRNYSKQKYDTLSKRSKSRPYVQSFSKLNWRNSNRNFRPFQKRKPSPNFYWFKKHKSLWGVRFGFTHEWFSNRHYFFMNTSLKSKLKRRRKVFAKRKFFWFYNDSFSFDMKMFHITRGFFLNKRRSQRRSLGFNKFQQNLRFSWLQRPSIFIRYQRPEFVRNFLRFKWWRIQRLDSYKKGLLFPHVYRKNFSFIRRLPLKRVIVSKSRRRIFTLLSNVAKSGSKYLIPKIYKSNVLYFNNLFDFRFNKTTWPNPFAIRPFTVERFIKRFSLFSKIFDFNKFTKRSVFDFSSNKITNRRLSFFQFNRLVKSWSFRKLSRKSFRKSYQSRNSNFSGLFRLRFKNLKYNKFYRQRPFVFLRYEFLHSLIASGKIFNFAKKKLWLKKSFSKFKFFRRRFLHFKSFKPLLSSKYNFFEAKPLKLFNFSRRKNLSFGYFNFFERRLRILNRTSQKHYSKYFNSSFLKLRVLPSFKGSLTLFSKLILIDKINQKLNILRKRDYKIFFKKFLFIFYNFRKAKSVRFLTSFASFFRGSFLLKSFLIVLRKTYFKKSSKVTRIPLFFVKRLAIKYFSYFTRKQSVLLSSFKNFEHFSKVTKRFRNFFIVSRKFLKKTPSWFSFNPFSKHSFSYFQYHLYNYSYKNGFFRNHLLLSKLDRNNKLRFFFKIFYYPRAFAGLGLFSNFWQTSLVNFFKNQMFPQKYLKKFNNIVRAFREHFRDFRRRMRFQQKRFLARRRKGHWFPWSSVWRRTFLFKFRKNLRKKRGWFFRSSFYKLRRFLKSFFFFKRSFFFFDPFMLKKSFFFKYRYLPFIFVFFLRFFLFLFKFAKFDSKRLLFLFYFYNVKLVSNNNQKLIFMLDSFLFFKWRKRRNILSNYGRFFKIQKSFSVYRFYTKFLGFFFLVYNYIYWFLHFFLNFFLFFFKTTFNLWILSFFFNFKFDLFSINYFSLNQVSFSSNYITFHSFKFFWFHMRFCLIDFVRTRNFILYSFYFYFAMFPKRKSRFFLGEDFVCRNSVIRLNQFF